jgi:hypothetical protein
MATLMIQLRGAQMPKNSKIAPDFWTMIYQSDILICPKVRRRLDEAD